MAKVPDNTLSLQRACDENPELNLVVRIVRDAIATIQRSPRFMEPIRSMRKQAQEFMEYQRNETMLSRDPAYDRVFPLETVAIREFSTDHEKKLESPMIHTDPAADEFARSLNALAVTIAGDIYFRNNAFNPTDEEGRKLLAHELTHVSQHEEKRITSIATNEELESEAERAEAKAEYDADPFVPVPVNGETVMIRKSQMPRLTKMIADEVEDWVKEQKFVMNEDDYLKLLITYREWLEEAI